MGIFNHLFGGSGTLSAERSKSGAFSYFMNNDGFGNEKDFVKLSLSNPVLFSVISTRAKVF